jgi:hypothetical protein
MTVVRTTYKLTGWNTTALRNRIPVILTQYGMKLDKQLKEEIRKMQFSWPNETRRYGALKNVTSLRRRSRIIGQQGGKPYRVVGSPRDIVDSGDFLRSQERAQPNGTTLVFKWNTPYASRIFTGYTTGAGTTLPPRNWIKPALDAQPLDRFFADQWKALAKRSL